MPDRIREQQMNQSQSHQVVPSIIRFGVKTCFMPGIQLTICVELRSIHIRTCFLDMIIIRVTTCQVTPHESQMVVGRPVYGSTVAEIRDRHHFCKSWWRAAARFTLKLGNRELWWACVNRHVNKYSLYSSDPTFQSLESSSFFWTRKSICPDRACFAASDRPRQRAIGIGPGCLRSGDGGFVWRTEEPNRSTGDKPYR